MPIPSEPEIVLDLSRLLSRVLHPTPTGVDRCEMAYARELLAAVPGRLRFAAVHPSGLYGRLPRTTVSRFLDATEDRWENGNSNLSRGFRQDAIRALLTLRPRLALRRPVTPCLYLQASPNNLTRPALVRAILRRERAAFVCLIHDLIPLQYPEYARPDGAALHARRMRTIADLAAGVVANSHATLDAVRPYLARAGRSPVTCVAHLGNERRLRSSAPQMMNSDRPYFVCIGTIEPRKNHLLLLNLWRRLSEEQGAANVPELLLIGRRGWENEQIVDMLERCPALVGCVRELGTLADREAQALLAGARALLLPSFAEGYGMPVVEAIALGIPVICSDLPALREAGGQVPQYLDPLDGPAWRQAILGLAGNHSSELERQRDLRPTHRVPDWPQHMARVLAMLEQVSTMVAATQRATTHVIPTDAS